MKHGKKYSETAKLVDRATQYETADAIALVKKTAVAKFDETIEVHIRTGCDGRHAEQQIRGAVVLPNGTGKTVKVLVFAKGDKIAEAEAAGADYVGGDELIPRIQNEGWLDFDVVVATPDMMGIVGRLGKTLGPKGLMPNPKAGTVTMDVTKAIKANEKNAYPDTLSGGMKMRVALARAIYNNADLYLMDEPFSALNDELKERILPKIFDYLKDKTVIIVSHNVDEANAYANTIIKI